METLLLICKEFHHPARKEEQVKQKARDLQDVVEQQLSQMMKEVNDDKPLATVLETQKSNSRIFAGPSLPPDELLAAARKVYRPFERALKSCCEMANMLPADCLHMGDIKHIQGVLRKLKLKKSITDMTRATYSVSTGMQLEALMQAVKELFEIVSLDNKFVSQNPKEPPCLHLKLLFKVLPPELEHVISRETWVMELQITTPKILRYKATHCHPLYEILRDGPFPCLCPVCGRCTKLVALKELRQLTLIASGVERGFAGNQNVALKSLAFNEYEVEINRGKFLKEAACHATLDHPHIVPLVGIVDEKDRLGILTELVLGGTLQHNLQAKNFSFEQKIQLALQICEALIYLHRNAVVHSDLKSANIFFRREGFCVQLGDFGLSQKLKSISNGGIGRGTPQFMSPEAFGGKLKGDKWATDVWALGCVFIEMFGEEDYQMPWNGMSDHEIKTSVLDQKTPPELDRIRDETIRSLVQKCLSYEPKDRPAVKDIKVQLERMVKTHFTFFLLDVSGSMNRKITWNPLSRSRFSIAIETIRQHVDELMKKPNQGIAVCAFNELLYERIAPCTLDQNSRQLLDDLDRLPCSGDTDLFGAFDNIVTKVAAINVDSASVILLTDGYDNFKRSPHVQKILRDRFEKIFGETGEFAKKLVGVKSYCFGSANDTTKLNVNLSSMGLQPAYQVTEKTFEMECKERKHQYDLQDQAAVQFQEHDDALQAELRKQVAQVDSYSLLSLVKKAKKPADLAQRAKVEADVSS